MVELVDPDRLRETMEPVEPVQIDGPEESVVNYDNWILINCLTDLIFL